MKKDNSYHVVSFSGGKDSTAMLLHMLELGIRIDEILFCDTGVEFPQMYEHIEKVEQYIGRPITRLKADNDFEYHLLYHKYTPRFKEGMNKLHDEGYSWATPKNRWCTATLKRDVVKKHLRGRENVIQYIGIAADEPKRIKDKRYPLAEWGWTEADCLQYCYDKGFDWGGLYKIFRRVSCWCCPLQGLDELRKLRKHFPELWAKLREWDRQTWRRFRANWSVDELDARFALEEERTAQGLTINVRKKEFREALQERLQNCIQ